MIVNTQKKECLLKWTSALLGKQLDIEDLKDGIILLELLNKTQEKVSGCGLSSSAERFAKISEELCGFYQVKIDDMVDFTEIFNSDSAEFCICSILLLVLTYGLQSKNAGDFKQSACHLSQDLQQEVMHLTEELLQTDPCDSRPITAEMLECLAKERDLVKSLPAHPSRLIFDGRGDGPHTTITYSSSPSTPLREWLDSPQMVQKSKLRMKEQELRRIRNHLVEEENQRHDAEVELTKVRQHANNLETEIKTIELKLLQQIQICNDYKDQVSELLVEKSKWDDREKEWISMQRRLDEYKKKAEEARWWEKEHVAAAQERDSLRVKALALDEIRGRAKTKQSELIQELRKMDMQIMALLAEREKYDAICKSLRLRNQELERRLSTFSLNDSNQPGASDSMEGNVSMCADPENGESMRVVTDLRVAELEAQLTELKEKTVPVEQLAAAHTAFEELSRTTVPRLEFENMTERRNELAMDKKQLQYEIERCAAKESALIDEKDQISATLTEVNNRCADLEKLNEDLSSKVLSLQDHISELKLAITNVNDELGRSKVDNCSLEDTLKEMKAELYNVCARKDELESDIKASQQKICDLECCNEAHKATIAFLSTSVDESNSKVDQQSKELQLKQERLEETLSKIDSLERELDLLSTNLKQELESKTASSKEMEVTLTTEIAGLKEENKELTNRNNDLKCKFESLLSDFTNISNANEERQNVVELLKTQLTNAIKGRNASELEVEKMQCALDDLKRENREQAQSLDELHEEIQVHSEKNRDAVTAIDQLTREKEDLQVLHDEAQTKLNIMIQNVDYLKSTEVALKEKIEHFEKAEQCWSLFKDDMMKEKEELDSVLNDKIQMIQKIEEENLQLLSQNKELAATLDKEVSSLSEEVSQLKEERDRTAEELKTVLQFASENVERMEHEIMEHCHILLEADIESTQQESGADRPTEVGENSPQRPLPQEDISNENDELNDRFREISLSNELSLTKCKDQLEKVNTVCNKIKGIGNRSREISLKVNELEERMAGQESLLQSASQELQLVASQSNDKDQFLESLREQVLRACQERDGFAKKSEESAKKVQELECEISKFKELCMGNEEELQKMKVCHDELENVFNSLKLEYDDKCNALCEKDRTIEKLKGELNVIITNASLDKENMQKEADSQAELIENLRSSLSAADMEREELLTAQEFITSELNTRVAELQDSHANENHLKESNAVLMSQLEELNVQLEKAQGDLKNMPVIESIRDHLSQQLDATIERLSHSEKERLRLEKEVEFARAKADTAESKRAEEARACDNLNGHIQVLEESLQQMKARVGGLVSEADEMRTSKESVTKEIQRLTAELQQALNDRDRLTEELNMMRADLSEVQSLKDEISRLESDIEQLGRELQVREEQKIQFTDAMEKEWNERILRVEEQNRNLMETVDHLEGEISKYRRNIRELNHKLEEESAASAQKFETRERAFSEEKARMRRMIEEAREMAEAYRETYNAQLDEEREEQMKKSQWNSGMMEELTAELERVRENHNRLVEAQDGELQAARNEIEACREEIRQGEDRIRAQQTEIRELGSKIVELKSEREKLTNETLCLKTKVDDSITRCASLERDINEKSQLLLDNRKQLEEKDIQSAEHITSINSLSNKVETIESELQRALDEREVLTTTIKELQEIRDTNEQKIDSLTEALERTREEMTSLSERLASVSRDKDEVINALEHAERRYNEILSDRDDWRAMHERNKVENQRLKEEINALEVSEEHLRNRCNIAESGKADITTKLRDTSERLERQRKRMEEMEADSLEEQRIYRVRLATAEKRQQSLQNEVDGLESQLSEWRSRCQKMNASARDLEERLKGVEEERRRLMGETEEELSKERQARDRYRTHCSELQADIVQYERQCSDLHSQNRQLLNKVRALEMQMEFAAAGTSNDSIIISAVPYHLKRQSSNPNLSRSVEASPVYGNHMYHAQSEGASLIDFGDKLNCDTSTSAAGIRPRSVSSLNEDETLQRIRRRHSSPVTPISRSHRSRGRENRTEFDVGRHPVRSHDDAVSNTSMSSRGGAPTAALAALFSCEDEPHDGMEWNRIHELQKRNSKQLSHMQSSYPVETQTCNPRELANLLMTENSRLTESNAEAVQKALLDLDNPYDLRRKTASSLSDELLRKGTVVSTSSDGPSVPEQRERSRTCSSSSEVVSSSLATDNVFKVPPPPRDQALRYVPHNQAEVTGRVLQPTDKENLPPQAEDDDDLFETENEPPKQPSLTYEIPNTPKKASAHKGHLFSQHKKKQKYRVQDAERANSGEPEHHKSIFRFFFRRSKTKPLATRNEVR